MSAPSSSVCAQIDSEHSEQTPEEDPIYMTPEEAMELEQHEIASASLSKLVQARPHPSHGSLCSAKTHLRSHWPLYPTLLVLYSNSLT